MEIAPAPGPSGSIRVDAWNEGSFYVVRIGDSGPGIDLETAQRCGGSIELRRSDLGGAAFTVRIPVIDSKSAQPPAHADVN